MMKNVLGVLLLIATILPASPVQALVMLSDPTSQALQNFLEAESVELILDIDTRVMRESWQTPQVSHVEAHLAMDEDANGSMDLYAWSSHNSSFQDAAGSFILADGYVYAKEDAQWYLLNESDAIEGSADSSDDAAQIEVIQETLATWVSAGAVSYEVVGDDYVDGKQTVRYTYEVDMEALLSSLVEQYEPSQQDQQELSDALEKITVGGEFWIDTRAEEFVKCTLSIDHTTSSTDYVSFDISILFQDINGVSTITAPESFVSEEYHTTSVESFFEAAVVDAIDESLGADSDADGDGLTNQEEQETWFSDPYDVDSDNDGYNDYTEVVHGYHPTGSGKLDSDGDGLTDYAEMTIHWTDRFDTDSDDDGYTDGLEIANGYNPNGSGRW